MDIAVKYRYIRHLLGGDDPEAAILYFWTIEKRSGSRMGSGLATDGWKLSLEDYRHSVVSLVSSMRLLGFDSLYPIPIDPAGELLNGSHRIACALALGITDVTVQHSPTMAWAPAWDYKWFARNGLDDMHLSNLQATMGILSA